MILGGLAFASLMHHLTRQLLEEPTLSVAYLTIMHTW